MVRVVLSLAFLFIGGGAAAAGESPCRGQAAAGIAIHGPVLHVEDGRTLCVALGPAAAEWVRVRLADAPEPAAWGELMAAAFAKTVDCSPLDARGGSVCRIEGESVGARLAEPTLVEAGRAWRQRRAERTVVAAR